MAGDLIVKVGADVSEGITGIKLLSAQFERLQKLASLPNLSFRQQERLNEMLRKSAGEIAKFNDAAKKAAPAFGGIQTGANSATLAMTNLGRVVQDAPFGFIGIANNINPLLESFQRLKAESGSTGKALKALGSSFLGAGGLGLAVSVASTALLLFGDRIFGAGKKAEEAAIKLRSLGESIGESTDSVQGDIAKVQALSDALTNANNSLTVRKRALAELQQINKSYFGDLSLEKSSYEDITKATLAYSEALVQQSIVKGLQDDIVQLSKSIRVAEKDYTKAADAVVKVRKRLDAAIKAPAAGPGANQVQTAVVALDQFLKIEKREGDKLAKLRKDFADTIAEINVQVNQALNFGTLSDKGAGKKTKSPLELYIDDLQKQISVLEELKRTAGLLTREEFQLADLKVNLAVAENSLKESLNPAQLQRKINAIIDDAAVEAKVPGVIVLDPNRAIDTSKVGLAPVEIKIDLNKFDAALTAAQLRLQRLKDGILQINETIQNTFADLAGSFGEVLGEALAGNDMGSVLQNFAGVFADVMIQLGKTAIGVGIAVLGIKEALKSLNPYVAIAAGIALVGLGTAVKASISKIPKFAEGGVFNKPTLGIIGEAGPEAVIPLHRNAANMIGGDGGELTGRLTAEGDRLVALIARVNRRQGHTF